MNDCADPHFWLSFVDPEKPEGERFLGVAVVHAYDARGAVIVSHLEGCNPGGEVMIAGPFPGAVLPPGGDHVGRLLSRAEAEALDAEIERRATG
jgi:hypothetical protein